jgi:hypothetical protein
LAKSNKRNNKNKNSLPGGFFDRVVPDQFQEGTMNREEIQKEKQSIRAGMRALQKQELDLQKKCKHPDEALANPGVRVTCSDCGYSLTMGERAQRGLK